MRSHQIPGRKQLSGIRLHLLRGCDYLVVLSVRGRIQFLAIKRRVEQLVTLERFVGQFGRLGGGATDPLLSTVHVIVGIFVGRVYIFGYCHILLQAISLQHQITADHIRFVGQVLVHRVCAVDKRDPVRGRGLVGHEQFVLGRY